MNEQQLEDRICSMAVAYYQDEKLNVAERYTQRVLKLALKNDWVWLEIMCKIAFREFGKTSFFEPII